MFSHRPNVLPVNPTTEPALSPWQQRAFAAVWISLGLHGAVIALVPANPSAGPTGDPSVFDVQLVAAKTVPSPVGIVVPETQVEAVETVDVPLLATTLSTTPLLSPVASPPPALVPPAAASPVSTAPPVSATPAPAVAINSGVDLTYYSAREVDVHPRALIAITPAYPETADRKGLSGSVRLQLRLEANGQVEGLEVLSASPLGQFETAAREAFRHARFSPAMRQGLPVRALVVIEVTFDHDGQPGTSDWP